MFQAVENSKNLRIRSARSSSEREGSEKVVAAVYGRRVLIA
jgi:hypothetical protein